MAQVWEKLFKTTTTVAENLAHRFCKALEEGVRKSSKVVSISRVLEQLGTRCWAHLKSGDVRACQYRLEQWFEGQIEQ